MLLYLHGFNSSAASGKARVLADYMAAHARAHELLCPDLPDAPRDAIALCERLIAQSPMPPVLIGSSLGGFYATYLAERHGLRAVLVNPAIAAHEILVTALGPQTHYHSGRTWEFTAEHIAQLAAMNVPSITRPERYWLLVETGDEVLDWREAARYYVGARQTVLDGGDHGFSRFADYLDEIAMYDSAAL
jgi:predicted esterase YcpF (UPF0227 family)